MYSTRQFYLPVPKSMTKNLIVKVLNKRPYNLKILNFKSCKTLNYQQQKKTGNYLYVNKLLVHINVNDVFLYCSQKLSIKIHV